MTRKTETPEAVRSRRISCSSGMTGMGRPSAAIEGALPVLMACKQRGQVTRSGAVEFTVNKAPHVGHVIWGIFKSQQVDYASLRLKNLWRVEATQRSRRHQSHMRS